MKTMNPYKRYDNTSPADDFWGRTMEISRIFSRIGAGRPQSVSLIGEPAIGKVSLAQAAALEDVLEAHAIARAKSHERIAT